MELAFETRELRLLCESETEGNLRLGEPAAKDLRARLADLLAANSLGDLPPVGNMREVASADGVYLAMDLSDGKRLCLAVNHATFPRKANGQLDWFKISRLKLLRIESD